MEYPSAPYHIFISYGRGDDDNFVNWLYENLTAHGYKVWYDRESMESNGLSFLQNIRDALAVNSIQFIYVATPRSATSEFVRAEYQFALENCQVIIPVLRIGLKRDPTGEPVASDQDFELIPEPLRKRRLHYIDFRKTKTDIKAFEELLHSLANNPKILATLHGVINRPNNYIPRDFEIEALKESILIDSLYPTVVTAAGKATAVQGMGGIGKSVIAAAVCHDCDIRRSFEDGIYWLTLGQNPDIQQELYFLTKDGSINVRDKFEEAKDKLSAFLKDKNCLIVLDDVWKQEGSVASADFF